MAELTYQERLQPSLLDRLTDDEPHQTKESRTARVMSIGKLLPGVLRDLNWLLNTANFASHRSLDRLPHVADSTLNYGIPSFAGLTATASIPMNCSPCA